jgi:hypothetical protein
MKRLNRPRGQQKIVIKAIIVGHAEKKVTAVIRDSIIKNVQGWRLSDSNNYVVVKSFGGANISDMEDYLKPIIRKEPANLIFHVGTNDLYLSP